MIKSLPYKTKQFFFVLIKIGIVVLAFYFIYKKLTTNSELSFPKFVQLLVNNDFFSLKNLLTLSVLSSFNWFFEILKWQILVSNIKAISFRDSVQQSLGSLTASLFTPNRIGEYGAKAMYYETTSRKQVLGINLISNLLQMLITTILGVIGFTYFTFKHHIELKYSGIIGLVLFAFLSLILIIFSFKIKDVKIKGVSLQKIKTSFFKLTKKTIRLGFFYALARYLIFSFQFFILLVLFNVDISYFDAMVIITSMYLITSIIPSIFIFDVLVKGSVAVYLFSFLNINPTIILTIITIMWIFNFVLPSIIGGYYVLSFKLPKNDLQ